MSVKGKIGKYLLNDTSSEEDDPSRSHIPLMSIVIDTVSREEIPSLTPQMQQTTSLPEVSLFLHNILVDLSKDQIRERHRRERKDLSSGQSGEVNIVAATTKFVVNNFLKCHSQVFILCQF